MSWKELSLVQAMTLKMQWLKWRYHVWTTCWVLNSTLDQVEDIFKRLGFGVQVDGETYTESVPSTRWDIHIPADLLEEVARIYGYDKIPVTLPSGPTTVGALTEKQKLIRDSRHVLEALGLQPSDFRVLTTQTKANQFMMRESSETELSWLTRWPHDATDEFNQWFAGWCGS